jgi:hypothetical protein
MILVFLVAIISLGTVKSIGSTLQTKFETINRKIKSEVVLEDKESSSSSHADSAQGLVNKLFDFAK